MKAKILLLSALAAVGMMFTSCDDDDDNGSFADGAQAKITKFEAITVDAVPGQPATEETPEVPGTPASFTLRAEYKMAEGYVCGGAGFCYSTNPDPTIYDNGVKAENLGESTFSAEVNELLGTTEQTYIRAYVTVYKGGIVYSEPIILNEKAPEPEQPETPGEGGETPAE